MPVLETLRQALPELSKSERRAADYLLQYPNDMRRMTCDAIAAASGCDSAQRRIRLDLRVKDGFFVFACENSRCPAVDADRAHGRGLGRKIVKAIVERYDCLMDTEQTEEMYKVTIAMPIDWELS